MLRLGLIAQSATAAARGSAFPLDEPLDALGLERARSVTQKFSTSARFVRSPALASQQTAEALAVDADVEPRLRDCDYGAWAGRSLAGVQMTEPDALALWFADPATPPPGGESIPLLIQRVSSWLASLQDQSGQLIAITHPSVVRAAILAVLGAPPRSFRHIDISPLSLSRINRLSENWTLASTNVALDRSRRPETALSPAT